MRSEYKPIWQAKADPDDQHLQDRYRLSVSSKETQNLARWSIKRGEVQLSRVRLNIQVKLSQVEPSQGKLSQVKPYLINSVRSSGIASLS